MGRRPDAAARRPAPRHFDLSLSGARALKHAHKAYAAMIAGLEHRLKAL